MVNINKNIYIIRIVVLAPFLVLIFFLFRFQILEGEKYQRIAEHNFVRIQQILPVRGEIFDRNFNAIATNTSSSNLYVLPVKIKDLDRVVDFVCDYTHVTKDEIRQMIYQQRFRSYQELLLIQNVDFETVVEISEQLVDYPSLFFRNEHIRSYAYNNHFTGYVNRISRTELEQIQDRGYTINSLIGKTGIEKQYEHILKGNIGYNVIQVDATGRSFRLFKHNIATPVQNGSDVLLTIDNRLQSYIESIFPEKLNGAVVVLDPRTGAVLAYVSRPVFNLNMFSGTVGREVWNSLVNDPDSPLLDRVTMANYEPASAFKPIVAAVALENDIISTDTKLANCTGRFRFGNRTFHCWLERGHGQLNVIDAIKHSCNVFFYDLSLQVSLPQLHSFINDNQLISKTGIDLPTERQGFFPDEQWYLNRNIARSSIAGHKINLAIGQGEALFTPLQMATLYTAFANDGLWKQPYFFSRVIGDSSIGSDEIIFPAISEAGYRKQELRNLDVSSETMTIIQESLFNAVNERGGTGGAARVAGVNVYGKTGTGQNPGDVGPNTWFAGYASWQKPELSFAVIIEKVPDGGGGSTAAPIAGKIIRYYNDNIRVHKNQLSLINSIHKSQTQDELGKKKPDREPEQGRS